MLVLFHLSGAVAALELTATDDAFTRDSAPDRNYAEASLLRVSTWANRTGYVSFERPTVEGDVVSATLRLSVGSVRTPGSVALHAVNESWREATLTANTAPSVSSTAIVSLPVESGDENGTVAVDVSEIVRAWVNDASSSHGFALLPESGNIHFESSESGDGPKLEIVVSQETRQASSERVLLFSSADSFTRETEPDRNFGNRAKLEIVTHANRTAFLGFDIADVNAAGVNAASLIVPIVEVRRAGTIHVHRIVTPWRETGITAADEPVLDAFPVASIEVQDSDAGGTVEINLTELVQDWVAAENTAFGVALLPERVNVLMSSKEGFSPAFLDVRTDGAVQTPAPTVSGLIDRPETEPAPDDSGSWPDGTSPDIAGTPDTQVFVGDSYSFMPEATDPEGDSLTFRISNKPGWMQFDSRSGLLEGTPSAGQIGFYEGIVIEVSDGVFTDSLPPFDIAVTDVGVRSLALAWSAPVENEDGSPLVDLAGYRIRYGTESGRHSGLIEIDNPGVTAYVLDQLAPGTYYFVISAYNLEDIESDLSNEVSFSLN